MNWKKLFLAVIMLSMLSAGKSMASLAGEPIDLGLSNMAGPGNIVKIGNASDFLNWYHSESRKDCDALLTSDLVIGSSLELGNTNQRKYLNTGPFTIHIAPGARLAVNNPNLAFGGNQEVITVENGGSLFLDQGSICNIPANNALVIKSGGSFHQSPGFTVEGRIVNQNDGQESVSPSGDDPGGEGRDFRPILPNPDSQVPVMTCEQGKPPEKGEYPATDAVLYENEAGKPEWMKIPVEWDLSGVNFNQPGVYKIQGTYSQEALSANNLSNPSGLKAALSLVVQSKASIQIESADTLSLDKDGNAVIRIKLPLLPKEAVGLYLYYSYDQVKYTMASWTGGVGTGTYYNYLDGYVKGGEGATNDYMVYKLKTDGRPAWFKVQMKLDIGDTVTSIMSKPVKCNGNTDSGSYPGGGFPIRPEWNDDVSSGGNRGGGGQGTFGREEINAGSTWGGPGVSHGGPVTGDDGQTGPGGMSQGGPAASGDGQGKAGASGIDQTGGSSRGGSLNGDVLGGISPGAMGGPDAANLPGTEHSSAVPGTDQSGGDGSGQGTDAQTGSNKAENQDGAQPSRDGSTGDAGEQPEDGSGTGECTAQPDGAGSRNSRMLQYGAALVGTMSALSLVSLGIWKYRKIRRNHSNAKKNTGR